MTERRQFFADAEDAGRRLDSVVATHLARSRSLCAELIRGGRVLVDGRAAKPSLVVEANWRIEVALPPPRDADAAPQDIPIDIIHDEADFCVVNKPAGMATHPAPGSRDKTLVNALLAKLGPLPSINGVRRPGIVHRLDKDTSGLLVIAKTETAMLALTQAMAGRRIAREYDAVVLGSPAHARGVIDAPLGRDPQDRTKFAVREGGRRAVTHYRVRERYRTGDGEAALLELSLETGRTHQIRVHLGAVGHPIVGDVVYGPAEPSHDMPRQALHAARLSFAHPISGEPLAFTAAWPEDFAMLVRCLRARSS
ncbi:MAG: RNA pseudouridine synthase [Candidatus Eremiobacter antarcticus]|nr:RluA family pseudouridine synthase [Candidatus Eremiobacteraeota bacterium]PZR60860.1 MAG: RNA pseudouridine synthase [Candidatus Eremiobacter sp. RRmetagenome_bin22]